MALVLRSSGSSSVEARRVFPAGAALVALAATLAGDAVADPVDAAESISRRVGPPPPREPAGFWERRRPHHLLSGKVFCGCCGHPFAATGKDYLGCPVAQNAGCPNTRTVRRSTWRPGGSTRSAAS